MESALAQPEQTGDWASHTRVGYLIYRVERRLRDLVDEAARANGMTTTEYVALSVLRRHDGMSSAELARWSFVTPQAMNVVITGLEKRELVGREPDSQHRRVLRASVTPKGHEALENCDRSMNLIEDFMLRQFGPESVTALKSLLADCAHSLETTGAPRPQFR
jgi:DNA-binding MarR family transcriptional regulator